MQISNNMAVKNNLKIEKTTSNNDALQKAIKEMGLRETYADGVYCEIHNPNMPKGNYTNQRHYVWNESTQKMEELPGIYYISSSGNDRNGSIINNAALQARIQKYEFTDTEGIYAKNGKNYTYNAQTNQFEEITNTETTTSNTITTDKEEEPSIADLYEAIVNGETNSGPNKLPKKEVASEERHDFDNGTYSIAQYDADGKYIGGTIYNKDGSIKTITENEYYDDGTSKRITKKADGTILEVYIYDNQGRKIEHEFYDSGELAIKEKHEYNTDGGYTQTRDEYWDGKQEHTVNEYNADYKLVSTTDNTSSPIEENIEYNEDGRIKHKYILNADGSHSDFYYTYENGSLIQTQETIHYPDGNYTYIFKDGNGNLKEEQKVIHNELGGLTFDTTFGDGTRDVSIHDANDKSINLVSYSSDGNVKETQECNYDPNNPNLYTITTRNPQGNITKEEFWENYTYTDNKGLVWHGCHVKNMQEYDEKGNLIGTNEFLYNSDMSESSNIRYDSHGNVTNYTEFIRNTDGSLSSVIEYDFGDNGKVENGQVDGATAAHQYWYDKDGNIIKEEHRKL